MSSTEKTSEQKLRSLRKRKLVKFFTFYKLIRWEGLISTILLPLIGLYLTLSTPLVSKTLKFCILYYIISTNSIQAGYHRLWAHRSYTTGPLVKLHHVFWGSSAGLGCVKWWVSVHRAHHRYVDTDKDPHSIRKGLLFSHIGWIVIRPQLKVRNSIKECFGDDLIDDSLLDWQERNYLELFLLTVFIIPTLFCGLLWDDYLGGFVYGGLIRMIFVQNGTFLVNSVGHFIGTQIYDDRKSHKNNWLLSFFTFGEGNNNFHHEFSADFRNGIYWYEFDPIKYELIILSKFGLVKNLYRTLDSSINQCLIQFQQKLIDRKRSQLNWGVPIDQLPIISPEEFRELAKSEAPQRALIAVAGIVHDVTPFMNDHPGGITLIRTSIGKDATSAFNGAVYDHTTAAHNLLATMRVAVLSGGTEEIVWKQQQQENKDVPIKQDSEGRKIVRTGEQATIIKKPIRTAGAA